MTRTLAGQAVAACMQFIAGMALLLFAPAGTFDFPPAWTYLSVTGAAFILITLYLWLCDKPLLRRRMKAGASAESDATQKRILRAASIVFLFPLLAPGFDRRFGWSDMAPALTRLGDGAIIAGLAVIFATFRANSFAGATVAVAEDHRVIMTGPYAAVRHPMYAGVLLIMAATPFALGSWWGLLTLPPIIAVLAWRLTDEERILRAGLPGYADYCAKVPTRLIPFIW